MTPFTSRRLTAKERADILTLEAERLGVTQKEIARKASSALGLALPGGRHLIYDGRYFLLSPGDGPKQGRR